MVTYEVYCELALSFPGVIQEPHFEKTSFRVRKKIFATYDQKSSRACLKLSAADQDVFTVLSPGAVYAVENKWGQQGWTWVDLLQVDENLFADALSSAYTEVQNK